MNRSPWTTVALLAAAGGLALAAQRCARLPGGFLAVPPLARLAGPFVAGAAAVAAAIVLLSLLFRVAGRSGGDPGRGLRDDLSDATATLAPLLLVGLYPLAVLVLHPLGVPPAVLTLVNLRLLLLLGLVLCLPRLGEEAARRLPVLRLPACLLLERSPRNLAIALFAAFAVFYVWQAGEQNRREMIVGDEPHYLLVMDSIKRYGTPDVTGILAKGDFGDGVRRVVPHRSGHSRPDAIYEVHGIGLPILMVVPHALGGYRGVIVLFCLLAALVVAQVFLLCEAITRRTGLSLAVAALVGLTAPMIYYFRCIYPELPATLVIVFAARMLLAGKEPGLPAALGMALGIASLPWFHVKFLAFSGLLLLAAAVLRGVRSRSLWIGAAAMAVSLAVMAAFFAHAYGSPMPNAQYGTSEMPVSAFALRGVPGLLFDQDHGLIPHAPWFLLVLAGLPALWSRHRRAFLLLAAVAVPFVVIAGSHWMWWGGPCAPGRFILPVVPLLGPALVLGLQDMADRRRTLVLLLAAVSLLIGVASLANPGALTTHRHVIYDFLLQGQEGFPSFPKFFYHRTEGVPSGDYLVLLLWIALALPLLRRGTPGTCAGRRGIAAVAVAVILVPGVLGLVREGIERRQGTRETGNLTLPQVGYRLAIGPQKMGDGRGMTILPPPRPGDFPKRLEAVQRFDVGAERKDGAGEGKTFLTRGPYFLLSPVRYEVAFDVTAGGAGLARLGEVYVSGNGGRDVIARRDLMPSPGRQTIAMSFTPERPMPRSEFQVFLERPGKATLHEVDIAAVVELPK